MNSTQYNSTTNDRLIFTGLYRIMIDKGAQAHMQPQSHVFVLTQGVAADPDLEHKVADMIAPYGHHVRELVS